MAIVKRRNVRLFIDRDLDADAVWLEEREAHYLGNVLRVRVGDRLVAFNGRGTERAAAVRSVARKRAELELFETLPPIPESPLALVLLQALVKADAMDWIVQKATELGVRAVAPVFTEWSVVRLEAERSERRLEHWSRIARSACEQSGRHVPLVVQRPEPLAAVLAALPAASRLALVPGATARLPERTSAAVLAVGPEGGWSAAEAALLAESGFVGIGLGPRTLRAETAAVAACAVLQQRCGDL